MFCWKYLTYVDRILLILAGASGSMCGDGMDWYMFANGGDDSYLDHHAVLISDFNAHTELL